MKEENMILKHIGKKIKIARAKSNYTQEKLAEKISLSSRYISQLERGLAFGSADTIINICKALNISSDFLFGDLIKSDSPLDGTVEDKFLEQYLQLDERNRKIVLLLASDLVKLQEEENEK